MVAPEDEEEVLNWVSESTSAYVSGADIFSNEFKEGKTLDYDEL